MENLELVSISSAIETLTHSANTMFILGGAIMVLAMHAGFAFLEVERYVTKTKSTRWSKSLPILLYLPWPIFFHWLSNRLWRELFQQCRRVNRQ